MAKHTWMNIFLRKRINYRNFLRLYTESSYLPGSFLPILPLVAESRNFSSVQPGGSVGHSTTVTAHPLDRNQHSRANGSASDDVDVGTDSVDGGQCSGDSRCADVSGRNKRIMDTTGITALPGRYRVLCLSPHLFPDKVVDTDPFGTSGEEGTRHSSRCAPEGDSSVQLDEIYRYFRKRLG